MTRRHSFQQQDKASLPPMSFCGRGLIFAWDVGNLGLRVRFECHANQNGPIAPHRFRLPTRRDYGNMVEWDKQRSPIMPNMPSFWSAFEEPIGQSSSTVFGKAKTATREQIAPSPSYLAGDTKTITRTREADDMGPPISIFSAVPHTAAAEVRTQTETREEPDQEPVHPGFSILPFLATPKTKTQTLQREEPEQDETSRGHAVIPLDGILV